MRVVLFAPSCEQPGASVVARAESSVAVGTEVLHFIVFPVRPQILDRVQFRSVGRQKLQPHPPALLAHEISNHSAAVSPQAIPDDKQLASQMAQQVAKEIDHSYRD